MLGNHQPERKREFHSWSNWETNNCMQEFEFYELKITWFQCFLLIYELILILYLILGNISFLKSIELQTAKFYNSNRGLLASK